MKRKIRLERLLRSLEIKENASIFVFNSLPHNQLIQQIKIKFGSCLIILTVSLPIWSKLWPKTHKRLVLVGFIETFIQLKSLVFGKHRKMLMIAILLPLLFKSHMFQPPKTQFHRKCHQRIEKYLEPEVHSSHQSGKC